LGNELEDLVSKEQILLNVLTKPVKVFSSNVPFTTAPTINYAHREIKKLLDDSCSYYDLSRTHSTFYLSSELISVVRTDVWYDTGGVRIPCFSGVYVLESEEGSFITVGGVSNLLAPGDLYLWEAGKKITYSHEKTVMLGFNIAPKSMLKNQDLSMWSEI
jgi:hypothetical protein